MAPDACAMSIHTASRQVIAVHLVGEARVRESQACLKDAVRATLADARISSVVRSSPLTMMCCMVNAGHVLSSCRRSSTNCRLDDQGN